MHDPNLTDEELRTILAALRDRMRRLKMGVQHFERTDPFHTERLKGEIEIVRSAQKKMEELN